MDIPELTESDLREMLLETFSCVLDQPTDSESLNLNPIVERLSARLWRSSPTIREDAAISFCRTLLRRCEERDRQEAESDASFIEGLALVSLLSRDNPASNELTSLEHLCHAKISQQFAATKPFSRLAFEPADPSSSESDTDLTEDLKKLLRHTNKSLEQLVRSAKNHRHRCIMRKYVEWTNEGQKPDRRPQYGDTAHSCKCTINTVGDVWRRMDRLWNSIAEAARDARKRLAE